MMDLADIFGEYGQSYITEHRVPLRMHKVMSAIIQCRTSSLGGHVDRCDACGYERPFYNSCRNRHCPKCGNLAKERWISNRKRHLLPIVYFHTVFTIPDTLNPLTLINQRVVYNILFRAGSETLLELGRDPKHLGAKVGIIAMLHTWGQNLMDHPHLHCIVTGGGLSEDERCWIGAKKLKNKDVFFVHVNVLSDLFKKKFMAYLNEAYEQGELKFEGQIAHLSSKKSFKAFGDELYAKTWVTYCKSPFSGAEKILEYLGRYAYRVAISNRRLLNLEEGRVTFKWRDYRDCKEKIMSLEVFEFIRRFFLHILPEGFFKIRYYGILSSRNLRTQLKRCKELLKVRLIGPIKKIDWIKLYHELTGIDFTKCPVCQRGRMIKLPLNHSPP